MDKQIEIQKIKEMSVEICMIADRLLNSYKTPISVLGLSSRANNSLLRSGIEYVEQLVNLNDSKLMRLRNMGEKTVNEVKQKIDCYFGHNTIFKKDIINRRNDTSGRG